MFAWLNRLLGRKIVYAYRQYGGYDQQECIVGRANGSVERITHWEAEPGYQEGEPYDRCRLCSLTAGNVVGPIQPLR